MNLLKKSKCWHKEKLKPISLMKHKSCSNLELKKCMSNKIYNSMQLTISSLLLLNSTKKTNSCGIVTKQVHHHSYSLSLPPSFVKIKRTEY